MDKTDYKILIKNERAKIKVHTYLGFNSSMHLDSMLKNLAKEKIIIEKTTKLPISKEKIFLMKSIGFGKNPNNFIQLFPDENDELLYSYLKNYVKICKKDEKSLGLSDYYLNPNELQTLNKKKKEKDQKEIEESGREDQLRQVSLNNCKKEKGGKFLFDEELGQPSDTFFYFIKHKKGNIFNIIVKTLPPWFNGIESIDFTKPENELTKPFSFVAGNIDIRNFEIDLIENLFYDKVLIQKLIKSIKNIYQ